jgi:hypothetical protein
MPVEAIAVTKQRGMRMKRRLLLMVIGTVVWVPNSPAFAKRQVSTSTARTTICKRDAAFDGLLRRIMRATQHKDVAGLLSIMSDDFQSRFPFELGKSDFLLAWALNTDPQHSQLWTILPKVLGKPCRASPGQRSLQGRAGTYVALFEMRNGTWIWTGLGGDPDFYAED